MLIEGHLARKFPKNFVIPGLDSDKDDDGNMGNKGANNLFGSDADDFEVLSMGSMMATAVKPPIQQ